MQPEASRPPQPVTVELPWWRRWRALLMSSFLLIAALVVAAEAFHVRQARERAEATALLNQAGNAATLARATEQLIGRYQALAFAAAEAVFRAGVTGDARRRFLSDLAATYPEVAGLYVIDTRGRIVSGSRPEAVGLDLSDRQSYRRALAGERFSVGDLVEGKLSGRPHVSVLATARAPGGRLLGMVAIALPAEAIGRELRLPLGGGAEPLLVDRAGRVVFHGGAPDLEWAARDFSRLPMVAAALAGEAMGTREFESPVTRTRLLGAMAPVPEVGWAVGAVQPVEAALAGVRREARASAISVAAVALAGLATAVLLSHWLAEPVAALAAGAAAWSRGDLAHRVPPRWRNEFGWLARHFNAMAAALESARCQERALAERLAETNAALEHRVAELSTLFEVIPIGIALAHDPECRTITGNPAFERMLGMPRGTNLSKSAPADERPAFRLYREGRGLTAEELPMQVAARRGERVSDVEIEVIWPDGTRRKLLEWAAPLFDAEGGVRGSFLAVVDITEREAAEQALRESQARFEAFMAHLPAIAYIKDEAGRYLYGNRRFDAVEAPDEARGGERRVLERGETVEADETLPAPGGPRSYLSLKFPVPGPSGRRLLGGISIDVTEQKRTETALRFLTGAGEVLAASLEIESTLANTARLLVPAVGDWCAIDLLDPGGGIRTGAVAHADPAAEPALRRLSAHPLDLQGRHPAARAMRTGEPQLLPDVPEGWAEAVAATGEPRDLLAALAPRSLLSVPLGARGRVLGALTVARTGAARAFGESDVALVGELGRRAGLAMDNARLYQEAREATAARDAFLARASHELRTPLTSALGTVRLLKRSMSGALREPPERLIDLANRSLDAMLSLVNDLLDASKLAVAEIRLETALVDVATLVGRSVELIEPQAREREIAVQAAVAPGLRVQGDAEKLERVLVNLLANAVRHSPQGGGVTVEAEADQGEVVLRVRDLGDGIAAEDLERIFEPFVRAPRRGRRDRGTGLGLTICRQIVERHGGRIWAESAGEGRGSLFVVRLPARSRAAEAAA